MKAGRWWRDYVQECAAWTGSPAAEQYHLIETRTESGIVCRVVLHVFRPCLSACHPKESQGE